MFHRSAGAELKGKCLAVILSPDMLCICYTLTLRPWSFDSWVGGSTDELKKSCVGKKLAKIL